MVLVLFFLFFFLFLSVLCVCGLWGETRATKKRDRERIKRNESKLFPRAFSRGRSRKMKIDKDSQNRKEKIR